ncbi:MAG: HD domain-containing protein [Desulfomicrobium sp.]|nr:HD domain-containing protein [Desulfomicrobium sp.]
MKHKKTYVRDLAEGNSISEVFALSQVQRKEAKNGPYWQLTLTDSTGSIEARVWFPQSQQYEGLQAEQFVAVSGQVASFKDQLQMNITDMTVIDPREAGLDLTDFLPSSAIPPEELLREMEELLNTELTFKPWSALCKSVLRDEQIRASLLSAPGAKAIHHAYAGGLLEHTLAIMRICKALSLLYPQVDKEILLVAALFHDLGKAFELSHGISREYTDAGRLLGHIQIGLEVLEPYLRKTKDLPEAMVMHLKHLIVAHHGELAFGSPCLPQTMEAFILHYADNLDAKINTVHGALKAPDGEQISGWSDYHRTLGRYLYQPMRTPAPAKSSEPQPRMPRKVQPKSEDSPLLKAMGITATSGNS